MRGPRQEHDRLPGSVGPLDLRQHALLARFDEPETAEAELVLPDQLEDDVVAVVAGFDAVNRCPQLFSESVDVREVLEPCVVQIVGHAERVLGADQVVADDFDGAVVGVGLQDRCLRRHPVAEEDVDVAVLHRLQRDRHGKHGNHWLVAQVRQHLREHGRGRGFRGPADVREPHRAAAGWVRRGSRSISDTGHNGEQRGCHDAQRPQPTEQRAHPRAPARTHCLPLRKFF